jgi:hypothetical protein
MRARTHTSEDIRVYTYDNTEVPSSKISKQGSAAIDWLSRTNNRVGHRIIGFLGFFHRPVFGSVRVFSPFNLRTETDPVSETSCFIFCRISDDGKKSKIPVILSVIHQRQNPLESTNRARDRFLFLPVVNRVSCGSLASRVLVPRSAFQCSIIISVAKTELCRDPAN